MKRFYFVPVLIAVALSGCAGSFERNMEAARFALDRLEYVEAEEKARDALGENPGNAEASFLLACALLGRSVLEDGTYLSLVADFLDEPAAGESDIETFLRVGLDLTAARRAQLEEARDLLAAIPGSQRALMPDYAMQLFMARMFEISDAIEAVDPKGAANPCALNEVRSVRFRENLALAPGDGEDAGLPSDFSLIRRVAGLSGTLESTIVGDAVEAGVAQFFRDEFNLAAVVCP